MFSTWSAHYGEGTFSVGARLQEMLVQASIIVLRRSCRVYTPSLSTLSGLLGVVFGMMDSTQESKMILAVLPGGRGVDRACPEDSGSSIYSHE